MRIFTCLVAFLLAAGMSALAGVEVNIEFRNHPNRSGMQTTNQSLSFSEDEVEIDFEGPGRDEERDISASEFAAMLKLVEAATRSFEFVAGEEVEGAYVEVKLEYQGEDREIEVTQVFPAGSVPPQYVALQEKYFNAAYR